MAPKLGTLLTGLGRSFTTIVVLKGGSVTGLVVLMDLFLLGCACLTSLYGWHNTLPSMTLTHCLLFEAGPD